VAKDFVCFLYLYPIPLRETMLLVIKSTALPGLALNSVASKAKFVEEKAPRLGLLGSIKTTKGPNGRFCANHFDKRLDPTKGWSMMPKTVVLTELQFIIPSKLQEFFLHRDIKLAKYGLRAQDLIS